MPRLPLHALIWSRDQALYELFTHGQLTQRFHPGDEDLWLHWLAKETSFAFQGESSRLNVYKEARPRGAKYWYAYHTTEGRTRKRYLGQTARVTFARLEEMAQELKSSPLSPPLAPTQTASESRVVLSTKFAPPRLPATLVERGRLLDELDTVYSYRLLLLSASAGSGKTTLLSAWMDHCTLLSRQVSWLTLDELDNDPTRFWVAIITALRTSLPKIGETALRMLYSSQPPSLPMMLTTLLNEVAALTEELVLILDDYHVIKEQAIHDAVLFLLEHLPNTLHLVLASRVAPPLSFSRLRVQGQMRELGDTDLHFRTTEAASFLTGAMHISLSEEEVHILEQRTEGWIAGLQLAALALRQREDRSAFIRAFHGGYRHLLDYVQEDILAHLPLDQQDFVLQAAILSRVSAAVCQIVTGQPSIQASQQLLETVERANLFLVSLDEERHWYRFHDLFREALLARLNATRPELVPLLHLRAARWYETQGDLREAITHALAAGDYPFAVSLMERVAEEVWLHGEIQTLYRWVMALPDMVVCDYAHFVLTAALYLLNSSAMNSEMQRVKARSQMEQMITRVETGEALWHQEEHALPASDMTLRQQHFYLLRAWSESFDRLARGDIAFYRLLCSHLQNLDLEREDEILWQMIPLSVTFLFHYMLHQAGGVFVPRLQDAKQRVSQAGNRYATIKVMQWLALSYWQAGQLHQTYQECVTALDLLTQIEGHAILAGYFQICLAHILYQRNQLAEARTTLEEMLHGAVAWQQLDLQIAGYRLLAQIEIAMGNQAAAHQELQRAEKLVQEEQFVRSASWVVALQVQYWLTTGNLAAASGWAARVVFQSDAWNPHRTEEFLMLVRVFLTQQQYAQALEALERFSAHLDQPGDIYSTIQFLALSFVALHHVHQHAQAQAVAARLFTLTEPEGFLRLYLDEGEPLRQALEALLVATPEDTLPISALPSLYISQLLAAFEQEKVRIATGSAFSAQTSERQPSVLSISPSMTLLTGREQQVLRLLEEGATNREIARDLVVSLATAKKHVAAILNKLGAENRTQAVTRARELGLL